MNILDSIEKAFFDRKRPKTVVRDGAPKTEEYSDALSFQGKDWRNLSCNDLEINQGAVFGFSSEAFLYYLPGIYAAGIKEDRADLLVYSSIIYMLDRGNAPKSWDQFFLDRWAKLTKEECWASQEWLLWLAGFNDVPIYQEQITRAYDTLDLISSQDGATPLAGVS